MTLTPEQKAEIAKEYGMNESDTGSTQVQIALLTARIKYLTEHLQTHKHDEHSRRGLLKLVGQRRRHQRYLARKNPELYKDLIKRLGLRN